jgi:hypothetical protein
VDYKRRPPQVFLFSDQLISSLKKTVRMGLNNTTVRFSSKVRPGSVYRSTWPSP